MSDSDMQQYDQVLDESGNSLNLVGSIEINAKHYLDILSKAVDKVMPDPTREIKYAARTVSGKSC